MNPGILDAARRSEPVIKKRIKKVTEAGLEEATKKPEQKKKTRSAGEVRTAMYGKDK